MAAKSKDVIEGAMGFLAASNPQDEEFVVNFADKIMFGLPANVAFTSDPKELKAALSTPSASGRTALNDAVIAALRHLDSPRATKKVLILISDGGDNASQRTFAQALRAAQAGNAVIYTVGLFDEGSADQNPKALQLLAKETGGLAYFPSTSADVVRVCRQIAGDIRHQYTISYSPTEERNNTYRKIRVNVIASDQRKFVVRTRAGYFWPSKGETNSGSSAGVVR
jgi:VWFA-related protein